MDREVVMEFARARRPNEIAAARRRLRDPEVRRHVIADMVRLRHEGLNDSQIAERYRYARETVNRMINSLPQAERDRLGAGGDGS